MNVINSAGDNESRIALNRGPDPRAIATAS
jgi:hypothetical protein